jgi:hypothetical protein
MFKLAILILTLFVSNSASARDIAYDLPWRTFTKTKYLKAQLVSEGMQLSEFYKEENKTLCRRFYRKGSKTMYNRCMYNVIKKKELHKNNLQACEFASFSEYPNSDVNARVLELRRGRDFTRERGRHLVADVDGDVITINAEPVNRSELSLLRRGFINKCMLSKGWSSAKNWKLGMQ